MKPLIILVHIPKTGGTSLRVAAESYFGPHRMLYDYGPQARLTSELVRKWIYEKSDFARFREEVERGKYSFLSGHMLVKKYRNIFHDAHFISWIRQPAARLWSAYIHYSTHLGFAGSFRDFYSTERFQNQQSRLLGKDLSQLEFIGITEKFAPSLRRLNRKFGVKFIQHKANKTPVEMTESPGREDVEALVALNTLDEELYRQALEQFLSG